MRLRINVKALCVGLDETFIVWVPQQLWEVGAAAATRRASSIVALLSGLVGDGTAEFPPKCAKAALSELEQDLMWLNDSRDGKGAYNMSSIASLTSELPPNTLSDGSEAKLTVTAPTEPGRYVVAVCVRVPLEMVASGCHDVLLAARGTSRFDADSSGEPTAPTVLFPLTLLQGVGMSSGLVEVAAPAIPIETEAGPDAMNEDALLDTGDGIEMYGPTGVPTPAALAVDGSLHDRLVARCLHLYRALYTRNGVPAAAIDGVLAGLSQSLGQAPVFALVVSVIPGVKKQLQA